MQELTFEQVEEVSGGNPAAALLWGIAGSYAYDSIGGQEGLNEYFRNSYDSFMSAWRYNTR